MSYNNNDQNHDLTKPSSFIYTSEFMDIKNNGLVWYGTVWYGTVWYGTVWYGSQYGMVWYSMVWYMYGMAWYGTVWYDTVWYGTVWWGTVWYGMVIGMVWYGMVMVPVMSYSPHILQNLLVALFHCTTNQVTHGGNDAGCGGAVNPWQKYW